MITGEPHSLIEGLEHWAASEIGEQATVSGVRPMPGNAGLSFGFSVRARPEAEPERLVIRLAPPGVRRHGNTDVLAQVPLLEALPRYGVPVAPLRWAGQDSPFFGTDAFVVAMLPGRPLHMFDPEMSVAVGPAGIGPLLDQAVEALAAIHATPASEVAVPDSRHRSAAAEIEFWSDLLARVDTTESATARKLARELRASLPRRVRSGIMHGDFQTNNILYREQSLIGVLDWELAGIGPQLLDLGWLAMMCDPECWADGYRQILCVSWDREDLRRRYEDRVGDGAAVHFDWFTALACLRFGAIVAFNTELHRSGRRNDPLYDVLAPSLGPLLTRGRELVA